MCILNTVEYSALVRSRKYNKEKGPIDEPWQEEFAFV